MHLYKNNAPFITVAYFEYRIINSDTCRLHHADGVHTVYELVMLSDDAFWISMMMLKFPHIVIVVAPDPHYIILGSSVIILQTSVYRLLIARVGAQAI